MSYHKAPAWGWELSLVSGFKLEQSGKIHSYRIPLLAPWQIISRPLWPLSVLRCVIRCGGQSFLLERTAVTTVAV